MILILNFHTSDDDDDDVLGLFVCLLFYFIFFCLQPITTMVTSRTVGFLFWFLFHPWPHPSSKFKKNHQNLLLMWFLLFGHLATQFFVLLLFQTNEINKPWWWWWWWYMIRMIYYLLNPINYKLFWSYIDFWSAKNQLITRMMVGCHFFSSD